MKLAFVTELFHPSVGGQEIRFEELGQKLVARGHQVHVYTIHIDSSSPAYENRGGIEVSRLCIAPDYKSRYLRRNPFDILRFSLALWRRRQELKNYDAVVFNIWPLLPQFLLGPFMRQKCVIDVCETRSGLVWNTVYRQLALIPNVRFIGVNQEIVRRMISTYGVEPRNCASIISGVDLDAAGTPPFSKCNGQLLFFGRMTPHKNPQLLVESFHESGIHERGFSLHMAGAGPELERLKRDFTFPGVKYHGRVSENEKWELLRQSSLLIMPSRREGFPRVVAEAACVGTPTLSLDFPDNGTSSVVTDYLIGKVCAANRQSLVDELRAYAGGISSYGDIAQHCLSEARMQFSWDAVVDQLVTFLEQRETKL